MATAYWGYRSIMSDCPSFDTFSGCFEPPYRLAASLFFTFWGSVEAVLLLAWLAPPLAGLLAWVAARARTRFGSRRSGGQRD